MVTQARLLQSGVERASESKAAARVLEGTLVTAKLSTLVDAFNAAPISTALWPNLKNVVWDTGRAKFAIDANYNGLQTELAGTYDLSGSGIFIKATLPPMGANTEFVLELRPSNGDTNNRVYIRVGEATTEIQAQRVDAGTYTWAGGAPYSPTNHAWMRITEAGGTLTYATSADGATWTTLGTIANPSWNINKVYVTIAGGDWSATAGDCFIDNVNVAPAAVLYADDFNRANAALTTPWVTIDGSHSIVNNKVAVGPASPNNSYYNQTFAADQWAEADLDNNLDNAGVIFPIVRCGTAANADLYYYWVGSPGSRQFQINKRVGGGYSNIASAGGPMPTGPFRARLEVQGTTVRAYADGVLVASATDTSIATGRPGMLSANGTGGTLDNFRCGDLPYTPQPDVVAATAVGGSPSMNVVPKPAGGQAGDYYIIWFVPSDNSSPPTGLAVAGFSTDGVAQGTSGVHAQWFWKKYDGTEGTDFTVTGNSNWCGTGCFLVRGLPAVWTPVIATANFSTAAAAPTVMPVRAMPANSMALIANKDYTTYSPPVAGATVLVTAGGNCYSLYKQRFDAAGNCGPDNVPTGGSSPNLLTRLFTS